MLARYSKEAEREVCRAIRIGAGGCIRLTTIRREQGGHRHGFPGEGDLSPGTEAIFVNGGNIAGGAKQSGNPHGHAWDIRRAFPLLDLLGGCTDSFDLGESRLKVSGWLVCRENEAALIGTPAADLDNARLSAYEMIDDVTQTRQATSQGLGQMIYNCEALASGTQVLVRMTLDAHTPELTAGALDAAIWHWCQNSPAIGGQRRAGFGSVHVRAYNQGDEARGVYESYLTENREQLLAWLKDGTLGASARVVS